MESPLSTSRPGLEFMSSLCGVLYTIFYVWGMATQCYVNHMRRSTKGYSSDYAVIAFAGFFFLLLNQTVGFISPFTDAGRVHLIDLVFAMLMFFFSAWAYVQTMVYPSDRPQTYTVVGSWGSMAFFVFAAVLQAYGVPMESYLGVGLLTYAALMKALSTGTKYMYQVYLNYKKKSTRGVSPVTVSVDCAGAFLALAQMQIDSTLMGYGFLLFDPQLNFAKFLLSFFSGTFDIVQLV